MSHRAEEKERRRRERLEREEAARRSAARKRMLQIGGGVVGALVVVAVVVVLVAGGGGGDDDSANASQVTTDARAAGCTFRSFPSEGRTHTSGKVTYKTNPPTSGNHNPTPAQDGIYRAGNSPPKGTLTRARGHPPRFLEKTPKPSPPSSGQPPGLSESPARNCPRPR